VVNNEIIEVPGPRNSKLYSLTTNCRVAQEWK